MLTTLWINRQFRKAGYQVFATRKHIVINFYTYSLFLSPQPDGYLLAYKLPIDGFKYHLLTDKKYFYIKLSKYNLLPHSFVIPQTVKYYYRSKRRAYVNGVLMYYNLLKIEQGKIRKYYLMQREDGKQIYYSQSSFKRLFTLKPKYTLTQQLQLWHT